MPALSAVIMHVQVLSGQHMRPNADTIPVAVLGPDPSLPPSIQANREPYAQGDWRKEPYAPR